MNNLNKLFIGERYIKDRLPIMENVEMTFIRSNIFIAQDVDIQQILSTELYNDMIDDFNITGRCFNQEKYNTLNREYIQPCLMWFTFYRSFNDLYSKITNKGILIQSSDNSEPISEEFLSLRKKEVLNNANFYSERLINYLNNNLTIYDKYTNCSSEDISAIKTSYYYNGWFLEK
jgi:hypothetical protein